MLHECLWWVVRRKLSAQWEKHENIRHQTFQMYIFHLKQQQENNKKKQQLQRNRVSQEHS